MCIIEIDVSKNFIPPTLKSPSQPNFSSKAKETMH